MSEYPSDWIRTIFGNVLKQRKETGHINEELLAVTSSLGIVKRDTLERRDTSNQDKSKYLLVNEGDIAYNTMRMWQGVSGVSRFRGIVSPAYTICTPTEQLDANFAGYLLKNPEMVSVFRERSQGLVSDTWNLKYESFSQIPCVVPPLPEQKKIAEILSGIDELIAKLICKSQKLDALQASLTEEFVQELQGKMDLAELQEHAEVRTGVAKNAKSEGDMTEMPYMRVANVQDGYLDLSEIKTIGIDRGRIQRYLLHSGDVLINEGGDLDKVGRGVIWRGEIKECLHQNHVFAVRCSERLMPEFLSLLLRSAYSKNYFLGCAKQTTNLASINSTQLKQFPIPIPDLRTQEQFISNVNSVKELNSAIRSEISGVEATKKAVASDLLSGRKRVSI